MASSARDTAAPQPGFTVTNPVDADGLTVRVSSELDILTAPQLAEHFQKCLAVKPPGTALVLDLSRDSLMPLAELAWIRSPDELSDGAKRSDDLP